MSKTAIKKVTSACAGLARMGIFFCLLLAATLGLGYRSARAEASEMLTGLGRHLAAWDEAIPHQGARRLFLNGSEFKVVSTSYEEPLAATLDRFETECQRVGGFRASEKVLAELGMQSDVILRKESAREGMLACLDTGGRQTATELLARIERFSETGDLDDVGDIRYVFARSTGKKTTVLALWTTGMLPLKSMFLAEGDAPGLDPQGVPKMPGARRVLSAAEKGQPYSISLYELPENAKDPLAWYTHSLSEAGWEITPTEKKGVLRATLGQRAIFVHVEAHGRKVGIVELS